MFSGTEEPLGPPKQLATRAGSAREPIKAVAAGRLPNGAPDECGAAEHDLQEWRQQGRRAGMWPSSLCACGRPVSGGGLSVLRCSGPAS